MRILDDHRNSGLLDIRPVRIHEGLRDFACGRFDPWTVQAFVEADCRSDGAWGRGAGSRDPRGNAPSDVMRMMNRREGKKFEDLPDDWSCPVCTRRRKRL